MRWSGVQAHAERVAIGGFEAASLQGITNLGERAWVGGVERVVPTDEASPHPLRRADGIALGPRAYACPGTFSQGQAASRCASGWQLCTGGSLVDQAACNDASNQKIQGFYVAEVPARKSVLEAPNFVTCGQSELNMDQRLFFGCGKTSANILTGSCGGFTRAVYCYMNANWQCRAGTSPPQTLTNVASSGAGDGVLCCRYVLHAFLSKRLD